MSSCTLEDIHAVYIQKEAKPVNKRGEPIGLSTRLRDPVFKHWECTSCDVMFQQWKAVLSHLGLTP